MSLGGQLMECQPIGRLRSRTFQERIAVRGHPEVPHRNVGSTRGTPQVLHAFNVKEHS
jgi:hypothetical protein